MTNIPTAVVLAKSPIRGIWLFFPLVPTSHKSWVVGTKWHSLKYLLKLQKSTKANIKNCLLVIFRALKMAFYLKTGKIEWAKFFQDIFVKKCCPKNIFFLGRRLVWPGQRVEKPIKKKFKVWLPQFFYRKDTEPFIFL